MQLASICCGRGFSLKPFLLSMPCFTKAATKNARKGPNRLGLGGQYQLFTSKTYPKLARPISAGLFYLPFKLGLSLSD